MSKGSRTPTRRRLLKIAGSTLVAAAGGIAVSIFACGRGTETVHLSPEPLLALLDDLPAPERTGKAYGAGRDLPDVVAEITARPDLCRILNLACPQARRARMAERVRQEFAAGDIVVADRFVIARSEALLAGFLWNAGLVA